MDEFVVGAAQDRLGGAFRVRAAGELRMSTRISRIREPIVHTVGEEAKCIRSQEAVEAADDDVAASTLVSFTAPEAGCYTYGGELDDLVVAFVNSYTIKLP